MQFLNPYRALFLVAFLFAASSLIPFQSQGQCYTTVDWELTPFPSIDNPDFNITDTVDLCVEVYENFSSDWLQGVSISLPVGWELISATSDEDCGNGDWVFVEEPLLLWLGSGYYFDANNGGTPDGNPFNNYGSPTCSTVSFCFQVRMVELFAEELNALDTNSSFAITVVGDSWLNPGWSGPSCDFEEVTHYFEVETPPFFNGQELNGEFELSTASCSPSFVLIELLEPGIQAVAETQMAYVNEDGTFTAFINSYGQYDIRVKGEHVLAEKILAVNLDGGITTLNAITVISGDTNEDNQVNVIDVSNLSAGFGLTENDFYWNPIVDLNCDGIVNIVDVSFLSASFGLIGE